MMIQSKIRLLIAMCLLTAAGSLAAQTAAPQDILQRGKQEYQSANYRAALQDFRNIILNPQYSAVHGDAYYWVALSYMALNQLGDAEKNLEYFLLNYKDNSNIANAYYQKGRLLFLQNEYQNSIQVLYTFVTSYPHNPFLANAYYWIGESLYRLGHLDEAKKVFQVVVAQYPTSYKFEAAQYRLSVINLKERELELMKLLRWSQEHAVQAQSDFNRKEQAYEQAILAYQRKVAQLERPTHTSSSPPKTGTTSQSSQQSSLENQIAQLRQQVQSMTSGGAAPSAGSGELTQKLLTLKAQALDLKEFYLNWLYSHAGAAQ